MEKLGHRHHMRLDKETEQALNEICRRTITSKSALMRRYVQQGAEKDIRRIADQIRGIARSRAIVQNFNPEGAELSSAPKEE